MKRILRVDVCNYKDETLCNIYDNQSNVSGAAVNVHVSTERNGWKELTFTIPSKCMTENGEEDNFRLKFLKAEYRLRVIDEIETDYFTITEPKMTHENEAQDVDVLAGHCSQILKNKNLNLEFSIDEGNNVGTAKQILDEILSGTSWKAGEVFPFAEKDGSPKVRTFDSPSKTGSFAMISSLCELFDAVPIYHGGTRTVDLIPLNPFAEVVDGEIPKEVLINNRKVYELHYDTNIHRLEKTQNSDNIITRLYVQGAYGDNVNNYCGIDTCLHDEYTFTVEQVKDEYGFADKDGTHHYFKGDVDTGDTLIYSTLDFTSRLYIWNETKEIAYHLYDSPESTFSYVEGKITDGGLSPAEPEEVENFFGYLTDFSYYDEIGLFTDEMLQEVAKYQRQMPDYYDTARTASISMSESQSELSKLAESSTGFCKLNVVGCETVHDDTLGTFKKLSLGATLEHPDGVLYRSDYMEREDHYFSFGVAKKLKANGEPVDNHGSMIYVVHQDGTWDYVYVKCIYDDQGDIYVSELDGTPRDYSYATDDSYPSGFGVWSSSLSVGSNDRVYLFCTNSMSGKLGAVSTNVEAVIEELNNATKKQTVEHPVSFVEYGTWLPDIPEGSVVRSGYGWCYQYFKTDNEGILYFCWGIRGDTNWHLVNIGTDFPAGEHEDEYFYNTRKKLLFRRVNGEWYKYDTSNEHELTNDFGVVIRLCHRRDMYYRGYYDKYIYVHQDELNPLPAGNYAFASEFNFYWMFTTDSPAVGSLILDTAEGYVTKNSDVNSIVPFSTYPSDTIGYPAENEFEGKTFTRGLLNTTTGIEEDHAEYYRSSNITLYEGQTYDYYLPDNSRVFFYDGANQYLGYTNVGGRGEFEPISTPGSEKTMRYAKYARVVVPANSVVSNLQQEILHDLQIRQEVTKRQDLRNQIAEVVERLTTATGETKTNYIKSFDYLLDQIRYENGTISSNESTYYSQISSQFEAYRPSGTVQYLTNIQNILNNVTTELDNELSALENTIQNKYSQLTEAQAAEIEEWSYGDYYVQLKDYDKKLYANDRIYIILDATPSGVRKGLNYYVPEFARLADATYIDYLQNLLNVQNTITEKDEALSNLLGDVLKENHWQDTSYVEGDEYRLYDDAMDNLKEISHPEISYSFSFIDLLETKHLTEDDSDWPDIYLTDAIHLVDPKAEIDCWGYVDKIVKCFDKPWETTIEINTRLSTINQHNFTDVITRIANVAKQTKARQPIYARAAAINADGTISGVNIEGAIELAKTYLTAGTSNWHTDDKNNIIFEDSDGSSAMLLGGRGFGIANSKNADGDWEWKSFGSGMGFTAEQITAGILSAERIGANSITTDKLMSNVGQELNISSNKALALFATADGNRPAGSLKTTDSLIEINAGRITETEGIPAIVPASINIKTGGDLNMVGGNINMTAKGKLIVESSAEFYLKAGKDSINSTAQGLYIGRDGININDVLKAQWSGSASSVFINANTTTIGKDGTSESMIDALSKSDKVLGTALSIDANTGVINLTAANTINIASGGTVSIQAGQVLNLLSGGYVKIGNGNNAFTIGSVNTTNDKRAFIYQGRATIDSTSNGVYVGTDGFSVGGSASYVKAKADGTVNISGTIYSASADITGKITANEGKIGDFTINSALYNPTTKNSIDANVNGVYIGTDGLGLGSRSTNGRSKIKLTNAGKLYADDAEISGKVAASSGSIGDFTINSALYNPSTKSSIDANVNGVYIGTDGLGLGPQSNGRSKIKLTNTGKLYADDADITGTIRASALYVGGNNLISDNKLALSASNVSISADALPPMNYYETVTGIDITSAGMNLNGAFYINISSGSSYVKLTPSKVDIQGGEINLSAGTESSVNISSNKIVLTDRVYIKKDGVEMGMWARDDIVILNPSAPPEESWRRSVSAIEAHNAARSDWVLIEPIYNTEVIFSGNTNGSDARIDGSTSSRYATIPVTSTETQLPDGAAWYRYNVNLNLSYFSNDAACTFTLYVDLSKDHTFPQGKVVTFSTNLVDWRFNKNTIHVNSGHVTGADAYLASGNSEIYVRVRCSGVYTCRVSYIGVSASCDSASNKHGCSVYYYH